jgi:hypothetical protein
MKRPVAQLLKNFPTFYGTQVRSITPFPFQNIYIWEICNSIKSSYICRIYGSHSGGYEEYYLLGYSAV